DKLFSGIQMACRKLAVPSEKMEALVDRIAEDITDKYEHEVPSMAVGERVMEGLRELDHVAYVRFASVYRGFQEATDFVQAVKKLEVRHDTATFRLPGI
ncbi:MAG: nrdR, partial [Verrucomicrobia bacterium]|nr:nrdR [Verrucomicrobiota bacterium]